MKHLSQRKEQLQFFETWLRVVFDEAIHVASGAQLKVPIDLESFQVGVKASKDLMLRLANRFLEAL